MIIKKNALYGIGTILIVIIGIAFLSLSSSKIINSQVISNNQDVQIIKLSVKNGQYILEPSKVKKDALVRFVADINNMPGCSKSIRMPAFEISKTFTSNDNIFEFTPDKAGTFNIACSMNMYKGTLTVLESNGAKSNYVEQKSSAGSTCGAGGGGCGCGG